MGNDSLLMSLPSGKIGYEEDWGKEERPSIQSVTEQEIVPYVKGRRESYS